MNVVEIVCLVAGAGIAGLVSMFKGLSFVAKYPKIVAALLSIIFGVVSGLTFWDLDWASIAGCVITPFATAVASYEVAKSAKTTDVGGGT